MTLLYGDGGVVSSKGVLLFVHNTTPPFYSPSRQSSNRTERKNVAVSPLLTEPSIKTVLTLLSYSHGGEKIWREKQ